jgi:hypothetical protein
MKYLLADVDECCLRLTDELQTFLAAKGHVIHGRLRDSYDIPKLCNLDIPETLALIREFHRSPAMGELEPEPCAAVVLPELHRMGYRFVAITACLDEPTVRERRVRNLEQAFGFRWEAVHCVGLRNNKIEALRAYPASIWAEDTYHHAVTGAQLGHRAFLLDRNYNRSDRPHPAVTRVADWYAIAEHIMRAA